MTKLIKNTPKAEITANYKGGGTFVKLSPQFSSDGQSIFICSKESLLEYNSKTAKLMHEYKAVDKIVGFSYHLYESYYCITACTQSGIVSTWKTVTHYKVLEKQLPHQNILTFNVIPDENENEMKRNYSAIYSYRNGNTICFAHYSTKTKMSKEYSIKLKSALPYFIDVNNSDFFAVTYDNTVFFNKLNNFKNHSRSFMSNAKHFTCVAVHSTEEIIITGDSIGRVVGWHDIFSNKAKQTIFHWHNLPVQTVRFSTSGSYFYSGGGESVLVKWQYDDVNEKKFVPRIPGEICNVVVASNNLYIAVSTNDNAIRIFDNTLYQISLIQHMVLSPHFDSGIVHDSRSRALIMNGNQGHIQFYSPDDMSLLYSVDITAQNKITNERETTMINTEVTKVAISKSGLWFATIEERKDKEYNYEIRLKFWKFDESKQQFHLNTSIEYPHENSINSMLFQPCHKDERLQCVTVGDDKKFKIWQLSEIEVVTGTQLSWQCFGVGFYRNLPCNSLSFSVDGSLFATGFGEILTVWTPDTCLLKCSLLHPLHKKQLKYLQFGYGNQCHLLVAASKNQLSVWNILTLSMTWTVPISVSFLIADSLSTNMAVITRDNKVYVFSPNSSQPIYVNEDILKKFKSIRACNFIPSKNSNDLRLDWYQRVQLYFITDENELYCLCESEFTSKSSIDESVESKSIYGMMQPGIKSASVQSTLPQKHLFEKDSQHKAIKTYLESPLHTLMPIRYACHTLLTSLVVQEET
ncbi:WD repeat-containing protein 75 [Diabrotica undecimpunctata]|uniref:WD repeat-containing protein 75 n=1 Tax=Diabrotica undecimpunctata TaxID=50387 RepID=UPI003B633E20